MKKQYKQGDTVIFKIENEKIEYNVEDCFLSILDLKVGEHSNDYIFKRLNITDKEEFCKEAYGYKPEYGCFFPECKFDDYDALNRVIEALQKECDEYSKEHFILYTNGDTVIFKLNGKILTYIVEKDHFRNIVGPNSQIFKELGMNIEEAKKFCSEIYGYTPTGCSCGSNFPEYHYKDYVAANKIIKALQKKCEEANVLPEKEITVLQPKFKIGDRVRILPRNDNADDYPETYIDEMQSYAGEECVITEIKEEVCCYKTRKYYEEPYLYKVNINNWQWSSASLELVSKSTVLKSTGYIDVDFSKRCIKSDGSDYDIDKVKQIKSIDADETEIILTVNKNRKTF